MTIFFQYKCLGLIAVIASFLGHCRSGEVKSVPGTTANLKDTVKISKAVLGDNTVATNPTMLKNMFGINAYEWNFLQDPANQNLKHTIYEKNMAIIKSFSSVRHYMNWNKLENTKGNYTFNPTNNGSWDYDLIYTRCKQDSILVLTDLKNCPNWMESTYPSDMQDNENVPAPYGLAKSDPASYADQARTAFQFAARYGYNTAVDKALVKVDTRPRWNNDDINVAKIGMGLIKYIECDNERDKWWKGPATQQSPEEYAANMSAFYDGNMRKLGKNAGVKTADSNMQVVMGGLASCDVNFVNRMISWCKTNRGYRPDGSVNLCFDVINYHFYNNNGNILKHQHATSGVAPELSMAGQIADSFVKLANSLTKPVEVWVTESGYDVNQGSYQKANYVGTKSPVETQGDWILRTSLLYIRHGIKRLFFYQLQDDTPNVDVQYATSGLSEKGIPRPAADYILQTNKLLGNYTYKSTINADPLVDKYVNGNKVMYVLTIPDQKGRKGSYTLDLGAIKANVYTLKIGASSVLKTEAIPVAGKLTVAVSETPVFVEGVN
jgi:hypothetical protein